MIPSSYAAGDFVCPGTLREGRLVEEYAHSSFSSLVPSLLLKDTILRTYLTSPQLVVGTEWRRYDVSLLFTIV